MNVADGKVAASLSQSFKFSCNEYGRLVSIPKLNPESLSNEKDSASMSENDAAKPNATAMCGRNRSTGEPKKGV